MTRLNYKKELPFFPTYDIEFHSNVKIWWFAKGFSQSRYNYRNIPCGSNACTIITVLLAARFHYEQFQITLPFSCALTSHMIQSFAESVLQGNEIHDELRWRGILKNINLTVPEAIEYSGRKAECIVEWRSVLYLVDLELTLFKHLRVHLMEWMNTPIYKQHPDLYVILIADHRSVLFVVHDDLDTISLFDSHQHLDQGAFIAQVTKGKLRCLCQWFSDMLAAYFNSHPDCYELSFLYFKKKSRNTKTSG